MVLKSLHHTTSSSKSPFCFSCCIKMLSSFYFVYLRKSVQSRQFCSNWQSCTFIVNEMFWAVLQHQFSPTMRKKAHYITPPSPPKENNPTTICCWLNLSHGCVCVFLSCFMKGHPEHLEGAGVCQGAMKLQHELPEPCWTSREVVSDSGHAGACDDYIFAEYNQHC